MKKQNLFIFIFLMCAAPMSAAQKYAPKSISNTPQDSGQGGNKILYCENGQQFTNIVDCNDTGNKDLCKRYGGISICS